MSLIGDLIRWLSGGRDGYMSLVHCMRGDLFWIALTVMLDLSIAVGYLLIARHWWLNERSLPDSHAKNALANMKRIFLLCGTCGYLFIPIKMFWPAWRLYDGFLIGLAFFTWRYALNSRELRVVYHELGRTKQLAFELEESRAESKRKSFFLNAISHDLRTPLNGLMLQADLAEMSLTCDERETLIEALREIKSCARSTAELLGSFLELGRLDWSEDSTRPTRFLLSEAVDQVVTSGRPMADLKGLEIRCHAPQGLQIRTDRVKLERILQNLMSNAIKFTDRGFVSIEARQEGRGVVVSVVDSGVGIEVGSMSTIFHEFYQVNNSERDRTKGFGLGLTIAHRLARLLKGDLTVESELGRGSKFSFMLPDVVDDAFNGSSRASSSSTVAGRG
ncbi:sensor histidine kinase [Tundrisphaera lichenicola]|uniref:sensor histidine kinase n=1 Tax=Tundrisphaera lichenicola TaxID=2029860 RepID=UPI003EC02AC4